MNLKFLILLLVFSMVISYPDKPQAGSLTFDPAKRLYTSDKVGHSISELPTLLDSLIANDKPIILFVHGRGNEPKKSLKGIRGGLGDAVKKLESGYGANVLMFNWDSRRRKGILNLKDRSHPLSNMPSASQAFSQVIEGIQQYRQNNPQSRPISLIAHSMGNIVIETMVKAGGGWLYYGGKPLFSNVVFSASDADNINHSAWVEKVSAIENVYITVNADDNTLNDSHDQRPDGAAPLGLGPGNNLASNATYIDISNLGKKKGKKTKRHEWFNKPGMHDQIYVCEFFQQALTGQPVSLNANNSTEVIPGQRYKLLHKRDATNNCFK